MMGMPDVPQRDRARLRAAWAEALGTAPRAFDGDGVTPIARDDLDSVVVVELGTAMVVAGPAPALAATRTLGRAALRDAAAIAEALPGSRAIGSAHLLFTGTRPAHPPHEVVPATDRDLVLVREAVALEEWEEAGVEPMERLWAVRDGAQPLAVAGYQRWRSTIAHIGVVAAASHRGRGLGGSVAAAAVAAAIDAGLVVQWRCRVGNPVSLRIADALGFTRVGVQAAVALPTGVS
ncbi:GNAT family N-acetyltransferase [Agrococcus sp. SCSIO52902]|uniref:GNAT family N-acetyltransferase n=1 Tax=Agrococcus sp. SCSIO52902 TaxID=2933290 RepID=UPI001FF43B81|nr:GNAT family N-acetyltransferase [Agrococcus sp. SCSIO52902]UOW01780.1 GNAT family N-acetyltransferase [Agrococcus sp. SCSIO52902]